MCCILRAVLRLCWPELDGVCTPRSKTLHQSPKRVLRPLAAHTKATSLFALTRLLSWAFAQAAQAPVARTTEPEADRFGDTSSVGESVVRGKPARREREKAKSAWAPRASYASLSTASASKQGIVDAGAKIATSRAYFREYAMRGRPLPNPARLGPPRAKHAPLSTASAPKQAIVDALARNSPRRGRIFTNAQCDAVRRRVPLGLGPHAQSTRPRFRR
jgi:hypothetical protein